MRSGRPKTRDSPEANVAVAGTHGIEGSTWNDGVSNADRLQESGWVLSHLNGLTFVLWLGAAPAKGVPGEELVELEDSSCMADIIF